MALQKYPRKSPPRLDADRLFEYAVKTLAGRARSVGELKLKLRSKAERAADVDPTLARLKDLGYLNDKRFADAFATTRRDTRGFGKMRVVRDLLQRRVAPAVAEKTVQKVYQDVDETELIEAYIRKKYRSKAPDNLFQSDKELASAFRALQRAGFSSGNAIRVLKRFAKNPELLDGIEPEQQGDEE